MAILMHVDDRLSVGVYAGWDKRKRIGHRGRSR